jgi:hypothetical protein
MKPLLDVQFFLYQRREEVRQATNDRDDVLSISTRMQFEHDWEAALELEVKARAKQVRASPPMPLPSPPPCSLSPLPPSASLRERRSQR